MKFLKDKTEERSDVALAKIINLMEKDPCEWQIFPHSIKIFSINQKLFLELEDGTEHYIEAGKSHEIPADTFHKISTEEKNARFLLASRAA